MGKLLENSARFSSFGLARVQLQSRRTKTNSVAVGTSSSTTMVLYREKNDETWGNFVRSYQCIAKNDFSRDSTEHSVT